MELHILLAGVEFGPYTDDKARQLLGDGFLSASDPAKRLVDTDWQPLGALLGADENHSSTPASNFVSAVSVEDGVPGDSTLALAEEERVPEAVAPQPPLFSGTSPFADPPKLQVSLPSRARRGMLATRTGSLMVKEALQAAQEIVAGRSPVPTLQANTAPVPELEPEPGPPRRRTPVRLGPQPEEPPAPLHRKTIRLTGRIALPGTPPQLDSPAVPAEASPRGAAVTGTQPRATTAPRLPAAELAKFSGYISSVPESPRKEAETAPDLSGPLNLLRERRESGLLKGPPRKAIKLTGPVSLPGQAAPTAPVSRPLPAGDDDGPMVMPRSFGSGRVATTPARPANQEQPAPQISTPDEEDPSGPAEMAAEAARKSGLGATDGESLSESGALLSGAELAERRSLKITGSLRHPAPAPLPVQLGSAAPESGPLSPLTEDRAPLASPAPDLTGQRPPVPEENLPPRPPSGKIPVHQMPPEGVKVRTARRPGTVIPLPSTPTESLMYESPSRPMPPRLAPQKIELPTGGAFSAPAGTEPGAFAQDDAGSSALESASPPSGVEMKGSPSGDEAAPRPEKVRLRRPVKLELSSRARSHDSGRITLETFSKLASDQKEEAPAPEPAVALQPEAAGEVPSEETAAPLTAGETATELAAQPLPPEPADVPAPLDLPKRLDDIPPADAKAAHRAGERSLLWLIYAIVIVGVIAAGLITYLLFPRPGGAAETIPEPAAPSAASADSGNVLPANPPAAAPPAVTDTTTPASASPPASAESPAPANSPPPAVTETTPPASAAPPPVTEMITPASAAPPAPAAGPAPFPPTAETAAPPATAPPPAVIPAPATASSPPTVPSPTAPPTNAAAAAPVSPANKPPDVQHQAAAFVSDGMLKYQHGDLDGAIAAYNQALDLDGKSADAYYNRGVAKAAHADLDGAIADYSQALQIDPTLAAAYYYRGVALHSKANLDGALTDYNQAVQLDPHNAMAYFNRGLIRMQKDDIDGAIVDSTRAIELDPRQVPAYYDRGLGRLAKGTMDAALDDMKQFTQLAPQSAYTDYARLYIWLIQTRDGQMAEANTDLTKAMNGAWNGASDSMVTRLGEYLLGQIGEADLVRTSASDVPLKDQGQRCEAWYFIGMRKLVGNDRAAAIDALNKCVATLKLDYCEYILAKEQLRTLNGGKMATAMPPAPRALPVTLPDPGTLSPATVTTP